MDKENLIILIFASICFVFFFIVWYRICFISGKLEEWQKAIIRSHKKANSKLNQDSIFFRPVVLKTVTTIMMLGGLFGLLCAIAAVLP